MQALTVAVVLTAYLIGNIVTFQLVLGRRSGGKPNIGAFRGSLIGFAIAIGIVTVYVLAGHLVWRFPVYSGVDARGRSHEPKRTTALVARKLMVPS